MDSRVRKIFIESPIFSKEDEERFCYISTDVEDVTSRRANYGKLTDAVQPENTRFQPELSPRPVDSLEEPALNKGVFVMLSNRDSNFTETETNHVDQFGYSESHNRHSPPQKSHDASEHSTQSGHAVSSNKHEALHSFNGQDDVEDYAEARLERQRQHRQARQALVPQLDLIESEDEAGDGQAALDLELNEGRILNETSLKSRQLNAQRVQQLKQTDERNHENQAQHSLRDSLEVTPRYSNRGNNDGNPGYVRVLGDDIDWRESHNDLWDQGSLMPNSSSLVRYRYVDKVVENRSQDQNAYAPLHQQQALGLGVDKYQSQPVIRAGAINSSESSLHDRQGFRSHDVEPISLTRSEYSEMDKVRSGGPDFIEVNRQTVKKLQKTYGQIYSRKKVKENTENTELPARRRSDSGSQGLSGRVDNLTIQNEETKMNQRTAHMEENRLESDSAEQLWYTRSRRLAEKKEPIEFNSAGSRNRRAGRAPKLRKYPSEIQLNVARPVLPATGASSAPYQRSTGSVSPASLLHVPANSQSAQKVSVDINLNVISPRASLNHPSVQYMLGGQQVKHADESSSRVLVSSSSSHIGVTNHLPTYHVVPNPGIISPPTAIFSANYPVQGAGDGSHRYVVPQPAHVLTPMVMSRQQMNNDVFVTSANTLGTIENMQQAYYPVRYSFNMPQQIIVPQVYPYQIADYQPYYNNIEPQHSDAAHLVGPYKVLPPVGSPTKNQEHPTELWTPKTMGGGGGTSAVSSGGAGSYLEQHRRLKKHTDYKAYTVDDYRKLKKEMKLNLGSLGPDMDNESLKERKEKVQKQLEYAKAINERNKQEVVSKPLKHTKSSTEASEHENNELLNKRRAALEYAKNVPKPKGRSTDSDLKQSNNESGNTPSETDATMKELQRLRERHQLERQQVAMLLNNQGY